MSYVKDEKPLVDLSSLRNLLGGSVEGITEILNLFITHTPDSVAEIKQLLASEEWEGLKRKIHSIKAYYGYVGNDELNAKLEKWENAIGSHSSYNHQSIMAELDEKTVLIVEQLKIMLKNGLQ